MCRWVQCLSQRVEMLTFISAHINKYVDVFSPDSQNHLCTCFSIWKAPCLVSVEGGNLHFWQMGSFDVWLQTLPIFSSSPFPSFSSSSLQHACILVSKNHSWRSNFSGFCFSNIISLILPLSSSTFIIVIPSYLMHTDSKGSIWTLTLYFASMCNKQNWNNNDDKKKEGRITIFNICADTFILKLYPIHYLSVENCLKLLRVLSRCRGEAVTHRKCVQ